MEDFEISTIVMSAYIVTAPSLLANQNSLDIALRVLIDNLGENLRNEHVEYAQLKMTNTEFVKNISLLSTKGLNKLNNVVNDFIGIFDDNKSDMYCKEILYLLKEKKISSEFTPIMFDLINLEKLY